MQRRTRTQVGATNVRRDTTVLYTPRELEHSIVFVPFTVARQTHAPPQFCEVGPAPPTPRRDAGRPALPDFNLSTMLTPRAATADALTPRPPTSSSSSSSAATRTVVTGPGALISPTSVCKRRLLKPGSAPSGMSADSAKIPASPSAHGGAVVSAQTPLGLDQRVFSFDRAPHVAAPSSTTPTSTSTAAAAPPSKEDREAVERARATLAQLSMHRSLHSLYASLAISKRGDPLPPAPSAAHHQHTAASLLAPPHQAPTHTGTHLVASSEGGGGGTGTSSQTRTPHSILRKQARENGGARPHTTGGDGGGHVVSFAPLITPTPSSSSSFFAHLSTDDGAGAAAAAAAAEAAQCFSPRRPAPARFEAHARTPAAIDLAMAARNADADALSAAQFASLVRACGVHLTPAQQHQLFQSVVARGTDEKTAASGCGHGHGHGHGRDSVTFAEMQRGIGRALPAEKAHSILTPRYACCCCRIHVPFVCARSVASLDTVEFL
jgi:hypothetical protein